MGVLDYAQVPSRKSGKELGELSAARGVDALQKSPVPGRGEGEGVVRQPVGPPAAQHPYREVLVDHQHDCGSGDVGLVSAQ